MTWRIAAVLVALAAVVGANALLLLSGSNRNDPVGRLSPIAKVQLKSPQQSTLPRVTDRVRSEDD